jgi:hypothetical protein
VAPPRSALISDSAEQLSGVCARLDSDTAAVLAWLAANASEWAHEQADEQALLRHLAASATTGPAQP